MTNEQQYLEKYTSQIKDLRNILPEDLKYLPDSVLLRGLLSRKLQLKSTIKLLDRHVHGRKEFPLFFPLQSPSPHFCPQLFDDGVIGYACNARTAKGYHVIYTDWGLWDPSKCDATSYYYTLGVMAGSLAWKWESNEAGFITVTDVGNIGMKHVKAVIGSPKVMQASMQVPATIATANIINFLIINCNFMFDLIWKGVKGLTPQISQNQMHMIKKKDEEKLSELLSPEMVANKSYIPTVHDRALSRKIAQEFEAEAVVLFNQIMK